MGQIRLNAYDADVYIPEFKGLRQSDIMMSPDTRYAAEAENVETIHGVLQPQAVCSFLEGTFENPVETLASFHRRWYEGNGEKDWYVCCTGGKLYYKQAHSTIPWIEVVLPSGVTAYQKSKWSWVTYETNTESGDTVDVILMSNDKDGMIMVIPPDRPTIHNDLAEFTHNALSSKTHNDLTSPKWAIQTIDTKGKKLGVIERYAERIWGGAIAGEPDMLVYSAPYDPTDWEADTEIPEDGAGDILQPSWDGDQFFALRRFGDQLLAFKKHRIWRVIGVSPGDYQFQEQYGGGTAFCNTIAVDAERVFMGSEKGPVVYDGMSTKPYYHESIEQLWKNVNQNALDKMCATLYQDRYYMAFPTGNSSINNAMLVYNLLEGTILYYTDIYVESFLPTDGELYFTSSTLPGKILMMKYDSWENGCSGAATKWVTPWMDFGHKEIQKGGFDLYFVPEVKDTAVNLRISIQTEKKLKTKTYTINPLTEEQRTRGKEHRGKRLHFGGSGRKFRLILETDAGAAPWRLLGGLQLIVETDPD